MKLLFIGQNPTTYNQSVTRAFVGTKSYNTLVDWIEHMGVSMDDCILINACNKIGKVKLRDVNLEHVFDSITKNNPDKIIVLGKVAEWALKTVLKKYNLTGLSYVVLPHPSGLNRQLNDKKSLRDKLDLAKAYVAYSEVAQELPNNFTVGKVTKWGSGKINGIMKVTEVDKGTGTVYFKSVKE